jgi:hypothetical protein
MEKEHHGIVSRGSEMEVGFLRPCRQQYFYNRPCISVRIQGPGLENPRFRHEAPVCPADSLGRKTRMTLETRQRQLHDEDKSCGIQPAYIRVIYRRYNPCALARVHGLNVERQRGTN